LSGTTRVSWYQKGRTNLDFTEARDSEWQWHQLCHVQVCPSLQTDNHAGTPPLSFLQAGCPSCRPTNSVKALMPKTLAKFHRGQPQRGAKVGQVKIGDFRQIAHYISKTIQDSRIVLLKLNRKSYALYKMLTLPKILSAILSYDHNFQ